MKFNPPKQEELIEAIHDGRVTVESLPEPLYYAIAEYLKAGLYEGYGASLATVDEVIDTSILRELRDNIYRFSAAKTYQQVREVTDLLVSGARVRPYREFEKEAAKILDKYNKSWLTAEYNTAIGQGQMASKWNEIVRNEKLLPYLRYDAIGDACPICKPLDGLVAAVNDPVWKKISPLNHFNCFCVLLQEPEDVTPTKANDKEMMFAEFNNNVSEDFNMNPYYDKVVFNSQHAYFVNVPNKDRKLSENNFELTIPKNDA